jgi:hypothetical protein
MGIACSIIRLFSSFDELFCLLTVVLNDVLRSVLGFPEAEWRLGCIREKSCLGLLCGL